jgi:hypothetical protein
MFEFESGILSFYFSFIFVSFEESHLLVSWCAGAAWRAISSIVAVVGDLVQRTGDSHTGRILSGRAIKKSGDAVCGLHHAHGDEEHVFFS